MFGNPNPKFFLYKDGVGSFPMVDVSLFPFTFLEKESSPLREACSPFSLFHIFEREVQNLL